MSGLTAGQNTSFTVMHYANYEYVPTARIVNYVDSHISPSKPIYFEDMVE